MSIGSLNDLHLRLYSIGRVEPHHLDNFYSDIEDDDMEDNLVALGGYYEPDEYTYDPNEHEDEYVHMTPEEYARFHREQTQ